MSSATFDEFYREIYSDLTVSREESSEIKQQFIDSNPPPDKLIWLRTAAFRIGSEFLTTHDDNETDEEEVNRMNGLLLRAINVIVHNLEVTCMRPRFNDNDEEEDNDEEITFDEDQVENFYREIYADLSVDQEERQELFAFFNELRVPSSKLIWTRASAFRIGSEFLSAGNDDDNVALLKCMNAVVNALERTCMLPNEFELKASPPEEINVSEIGLEESISKAAQYLWDLDVNRLTPDEDYNINVQEGKKPFWKEDKAEDPLFSFVDEKVFQQRPTYKSFIDLLDNYTAQTGEAESVTSHERKENWTFLRAIMQSGPMQFCHQYCIANNPDIPEDRDEFMKLLYNIWFKMYTRDRNGDGNDSSGFEHVFVGEIKNSKVSGFHNWIFFYLEEQKGNLDYRGYIKPRNRNNAETNNDDQILTLQFTWHGIEKMVGTSFIGVSPEFEMALYTMCFLVGQEENIIDLNTGTDEFRLNCKVYRFGNRISTSFVEAQEHFD